MDVALLVRLLGSGARGELGLDPAGRELYSCDASLYRRRPVATLRARDADDLDVAVDACVRSGVPLTMRGAGTSLAGQAVGRGLVVDCSGLAQVEVDPDSRTAWVGPGVVLDDLNRQARRHGLAFGADVATASRATLGGMIANNSAGARSVVHGLTADHVLSLEVTLASGERWTAAVGSRPPAQVEGLPSLAAQFSPPALLRRVSGYALDALSGSHPRWQRLLCGSEGTLAVTRRARVRLVDLPQARALALVPFSSVGDALSSVPDLLATEPSAIELMDGSMVDPANRPPAARALPAALSQAAAILIVEYSGHRDDVVQAARTVGGGGVALTDGEQAAVWALRRGGIARAMRGDPGVGRDAAPLAFIEDPAVPPQRLARFAQEVRHLLDSEGTPAVWFGHASVGCLHIRPLMDLRQPGSVVRLRRIAEGVADIVVAHDGSLSGEHGDGRVRSELLPRMYPPVAMAAFASVKDAFDPMRVLNPGIIVDPEPLDRGLRLRESPPRRPWRTAVSFGAEGGLVRAAEACNGNGTCRAHGGAMCPSYQALNDERHSTRGRAVLFRAAVEGRLPGGLSNDGLHRALDLCLGCRACASECPAQVDMARMKVEALAHRRPTGRDGAVRLLAGYMPRLLRIGGRLSGRSGLATAAIERLLGVSGLPRPATPWALPPPPAGRPSLVVMADTISRFVDPTIGSAAVRVLGAAGERVVVVDPGCCGRTLYSQGFPAQARRVARRALDRLAPHALAGLPIVVLEPSCASMLRDELPHLLPNDPRVPWVAERLSTIEERLAATGLALGATTAAAGTMALDHCHAQAAGQGGATARALEDLTGAPVSRLPAGCCGMAGTFGLLHPTLSARIAERRLLPALADADRIVAAGHSCRAQIARLTDRRPLHPAHYLDHLLSERR